MQRFTILLLTALLALTACGPQTVVPAAPATVTAPTSLPSLTAAPAAATLLPTDASMPQPQATSRGDKLVASDPASVNFASGKPVLVEFFRFT